MKILLLTQILLVSFLCKSQTVKIFVDSNNLNTISHMQIIPDLPIGNTYDYSKMNWIINSQKITWSLDTFKIQINKTGFDTIKYFVSDKPDTLTLICKFMTDSTYLIVCNECCGGFNLLSIKSVYNMPDDRITFKFKNRPKVDSLYAGASNSIVGSAFSINLKNKFTLNYLRSLANSIANIAIFSCKIDTTKNCTINYCFYRTKKSVEDRCIKDKVDLYNIKFVFLHSENLLITYDFKSKEVLCKLTKRRLKD